MKKIAIIDYGLGNLRSVYNSLEFIGAAPFICDKATDLSSADSAILPGVGAFGDGMTHLRDNGWIEEINKFVHDNQKPFLGICLGMQLLAEEGTEHGNHKGLGLIKGKVVKFSTNDNAIRIPHIGWNDIEYQNNKKTYSHIEMPEDFYFVHSYVFEPEDQSVISGICNHGQDFVASVEHDNIWGHNSTLKKVKKPD